MKSKNQIIYYDFNDINYSSYYLTGFIQNAEIFHYKFVVLKKPPSLLFDPIMDCEWRNILFSICLFKAKIRNEEFYFCIDTRDSCEAKSDRGMGYHLPLLKKVRYYFKVNYNEDAINNDLNLGTFAYKIIPILPFFPIKVPRLFPFLPRIIPCSSIAWTMRDAVKRVKDLRNLLTIEQIRQLRNLKKDIDLFFVMGFYGQKIHSAEDEFRYQIMKEIQKYRTITSIVGFASGKKLPGKFAEFQLKWYPLKEYLSWISRSRIAIYVRGVHNCLSFKFGQLLSLGMPIVGQTIPNNKSMLYNNKYFHDQFAFDNPKEIIQNAINLLDRPDKLIKLGESNAKVFDIKFTPKAVIYDLLKHLIV